MDAGRPEVRQARRQRPHPRPRLSLPTERELRSRPQSEIRRQLAGGSRHRRGLFSEEGSWVRGRTDWQSVLQQRSGTSGRGPSEATACGFANRPSAGDTGNRVGRRLRGRCRAAGLERLGASSGAGSGASLPAGYVCPADGRSRLRVREPDARRRRRTCGPRGSSPTLGRAVSRRGAAV